MNNAIFRFPKPINEPVQAYAPGSSEKLTLKKELARLSSEEWDIPLVIGGKEIRTGNTGKVVMVFNHHWCKYGWKKHLLTHYWCQFFIDLHRRTSMC